MTTPTYLVAKYAPDVVRMEPRNIGVILWASSGVAFRFLPPSQARFVDDRKMYERWTGFWARSCGGSSLQTKRGEIIKTRSPDFLKALIETQAGNYFLYEGGVITADVPADERQNATDFLYRKLVSDYGLEESDDSTAQASSFAERCEALLETVGLASRKDFQEDYPLELKAGGVPVPCKFDYALAEESPSALLLRVDHRNQQSTNNAAFLFEHVKANQKAKRAKRLAFIDNSVMSEASPSRTVMLGQLCDEVIDLADLEKAAQKLHRLQL